MLDASPTRRTVSPHLACAVPYDDPPPHFVAIICGATPVGRRATIIIMGVYSRGGMARFGREVMKLLACVFLRMRILQPRLLPAMGEEYGASARRICDPGQTNWLLVEDGRS
jgi:hypothetical protein